MLGVKFRWLAALGLLAAVATSAAYAAFDSGEGSRPTLSLASEDPLAVNGRGFKAGERVTIVATNPGKHVRKTVTASEQGRFTARVRAFDASCGMLFVKAVGQEGSQASFRRRGISAPCGMDQAPGADLNG